MSRTRSLDVAIVGAGFGGLYAIHRLRGLGLDLELPPERLAGHRPKEARSKSTASRLDHRLGSERGVGRGARVGGKGRGRHPANLSGAPANVIFFTQCAKKDYTSASGSPEPVPGSGGDGCEARRSPA